MAQDDGGYLPTAESSTEFDVYAFVLMRRSEDALEMDAAVAELCNVNISDI